MFKKLIGYMWNRNRFVEQGHVVFFGLMALLFMPLAIITKWLYFVPPTVLLAMTIYNELIMDDWIHKWSEEPWKRPDLFYDFWTKVILASGFAFAIVFAVNPTKWWEFCYFPGIAVLGLLLPYKFKIFQDRPREETIAP